MSHPNRERVAELSVFVSYSHAQAPWVRTRLVPCLKAGGVEVRIDVERFRAGIAVYKQMDAEQDACDKHLLVLSDEYLASGPCRHEMNRAIARDPAFDGGTIIPVRRTPCTLPPGIAIPNPLYIDLTDDGQSAAWERLLTDCGASLGVSPSKWISARDSLYRIMVDGRSANLICNDEANWKYLIENSEDIARQSGAFISPVVAIDFHDPRTSSLSDFINLLNFATKANTGSININKRKLSDLYHSLDGCEDHYFIFTSYHMTMIRGKSGFDADFYGALRYLVQEVRKMKTIIHSNTPLASIAPLNYPGSPFDIATIDLRMGNRNGKSSFE
ncbi:MAG TPA: toll/interleukin-1 receptor domain-containing protein [Azospirillum sp.]